jgi:hypothetical protein
VVLPVHIYRTADVPPITEFLGKVSDVPFAMVVDEYDCPITFSMNILNYHQLLYIQTLGNMSQPSAIKCSDANGVSPTVYTKEYKYAGGVLVTLSLFDTSPSPYTLPVALVTLMCNI